jgi:hypothetical protein
VSGKDDDGRKTQAKFVAKAATPLWFRAVCAHGNELSSLDSSVRRCMRNHHFLLNLLNRSGQINVS